MQKNSNGWKNSFTGSNLFNYLKNEMIIHKCSFEKAQKHIKKKVLNDPDEIKKKYNVNTKLMHGYEIFYRN